MRTQVAADHARITAHRADTTARVTALLGSLALAPFRAGLQTLSYRSPTRATRAVKGLLVGQELPSEVRHALASFVGLLHVGYLLY